MAAKIAIIEDDIAIVQMYRRKFELEGYTVETAGDGVAGLKLIEDFRPDVVLLDLMMPNMDGETMLSELKKRPELNTKIVVLTNKGDSNATINVRELGVIDYIIKADMTPKQVEERIKQLLK